jgi:RNA polymerase sigma-70 factor, ECF subfamily
MGQSLLFRGGICSIALPTRRPTDPVCSNADACFTISISMPLDAEAELLARCRRGDPEAWDVLFDQYFEPAARFVFQLAYDFSREDVEEICQEAFLAVVRNLHAFNGKSQFQTWLFRIAANKARDFRERAHAAKRGGGKAPLSFQAMDPETGLTLDAPSQDPAPDLALLNDEQNTLIHKALANVGEPCREIIELRYFGDLSYEEISQTLDLNLKTVSSRLSKCLDRLEIIVRTIFSGENSTTSPSNR